MNSDMTPPASAPAAPSGPPDVRAEKRARRVVLLLVMLWILNGFDLALTVICTSTPELDRFAEANPIARYFLEQPGAVISFKLGALAFASTVLFMLRRRVVAELGCWLLCAVYVALAFHWLGVLTQYKKEGTGLPAPPLPAPSSYVIPAELERRWGQADGPAAADVHQQPQRQAVHQQA